MYGALQTFRMRYLPGVCAEDLAKWLWEHGMVRDSRDWERGQLWIEWPELHEAPEVPGWIKPYYRRTGIYTGRAAPAEVLVLDVCRYLCGM